MKPSRFALAALLLCAAGSSGAGVPVIELAPSAHAAAQAAAPAQALQRGAARLSQDLARDLPLELRLAGQRPAPIRASAASTAFPIAAGELVAARRQPPFGGLLLLLVGCIFYLARHRGQGFALRPAQPLL